MNLTIPPQLMQSGEDRGADKDDQRFSPTQQQQQTQYASTANSRSSDTNSMPLWYQSMFPIVPQPFKTIENDEDDTVPLTTDYDDTPLSLILFPTHDSIIRYIEAQETRTKLLKHIKEKIRGEGKKQTKARKKYVDLVSWRKDERHGDDNRLATANLKLLIDAILCSSVSASRCQITHSTIRSIFVFFINLRISSSLLGQ